MIDFEFRAARSAVRARDQISLRLRSQYRERSDRVSINAWVEFAGRTTRSLPLLVLTSLGLDWTPQLKRIS